MEHRYTGIRVVMKTSEFLFERFETITVHSNKTVKHTSVSHGMLGAPNQFEDLATPEQIEICVPVHVRFSVLGRSVKV